MNGQYCKSGLAFLNTNDGAAECTDAFAIKQNGVTLDVADNYRCDPTDNENPCQIFYSDNDYFDVPCMCSLQGQEGYCAAILGTEVYMESLISLKRMLEKSNCHTGDRHNFQAQLDCNTEVESVEPAAVQFF